MRPGLVTLLLALALATPVGAACKDSFTRTELQHYGLVEFRSFDTVSGVGQTEAAKRLALRLKDEGYGDVQRKGNSVIGWLGLTGKGQPSALRFVATGSGDRTRIEAILTAPIGNAVRDADLRAALCAVLASAGR